MKRTLGFALLFTAAYLLVFSSPLKKEPVIKPMWVQNLTHPSMVAGASSSGNIIGFRIGRVFGYATTGGAIKYLDTAQFNVAMTNDRFINFSSVSKNLVVKDSSGRIQQTIESRGYPIFLSGRFFVVNTNRTAMSELDQEGTVRWTRDFGSVIGSMDANAQQLVVGLLNGSVLLLGNDGRIAYSYSPSGSKIPAIFGCAISADGDHVAVIAGLEPQKFVLLTRDKKGYRPQRVVDFVPALRRQVLIHFFPGIPYVYVESPAAVHFYPLNGGSIGQISVLGRVAGMTMEKGPLLLDVSRQANARGRKDNAELTVFAPPGQVIARARFAGQQLFVSGQGNSLYLGADKNLMRIGYQLE